MPFEMYMGMLVDAGQKGKRGRREKKFRV